MKIKTTVKIISTISIVTFIIYFFIDLIVFRNSVVFNFFFTPKEFTKPMLISKIEINKKEVFSGYIVNKYPGNYDIDLIPTKKLQALKKYKLNSSILIETYDNEALIYKKQVSLHEMVHFWNDGKFGTGITILDYEVPQDMPRNKKLKLTLSILEQDSEFNKDYGSTTLVVRKGSDE